MNDQIAVYGIRGFGHHGVLAHEREFGQEFSVDVVLETGFDAAAATDDLRHTVDYGSLAALVHARLTGEPFLLIETLADRIASEVVALPGVRQATVSVHKPHAPMPVGVADVVVTRRRRAPVRVVLGLGSNLGDRLGHLQAAVDQLASAGVRLTAVSPVMRTAPVGGPAGQDDFLNAVVAGYTDASAMELLRICQEIENAAGRQREVRWGARPIDVDILDFGGQRVNEPDLQLPHPRVTVRAFVLAPWALMSPGDRLGGALGPRIAELAAAVGSEGVEVVDGLEISL